MKATWKLSLWLLKADTQIKINPGNWQQNIFKKQIQKPQNMPGLEIFSKLTPKVS